MFSQVSVLKASLYQFFEKNSLDPIYVHALASKFCSDQICLDTFARWFASEYPKLQSNASRTSKKWVKALDKKTKFIEQCGNFSQENLKNCMIRFLIQYPQADSEELIEKLDADGHCLGFSFLVGMSKILQYEFKLTDAELNDWESVRKVFKKLIDWDCKSAFDPEDVKNIYAKLRLIYDVQHGETKLSIYGTSWHKIANITHKIALKNIHNVIFPFTDEGINLAIKKIFSPNKKPSDERKEDKSHSSQRRVVLSQIQIGKHCSLVIAASEENEGQVQVEQYDPNNFTEVVDVKDQSHLRVLLKATHLQFADINACIVIRQFSRHANDSYPSMAECVPAYAIKKMSVVEMVEALEWSLCTGDVNLFKFWLNQGLDMTSMEISPMFHISSFGHVELLQYFLESNPGILDINGVTENLTSGRRAIHIAARRGYADFVRVLLEHSVDVNAKMYRGASKRAGWTALMNAANFGHLETVKVLLEYKASLEARTPEGKTALFFAVESNRLDVVEFLIRKGANGLAKTYDDKKLSDFVKSREMQKLLTRLVPGLAVGPPRRDSGAFLWAQFKPDGPQKRAVPAKVFVENSLGAGDWQVVTRKRHR